MEDLDVARVVNRSIKGIFALISRTFVIQIISLISNFSLTIFLTPEVFGIFFVVSAAIAFLSYFSDIGLAAALIQKKELITDDDLKTTFTIQQGLVLTISLVAFLLSGTIGNFYNLQIEGIHLFQALIIAFFLSSLKTIPSIILERNLQFQKLIIPQIVENLLFNITALILAIKGFGINSFTYAVIIRGIAGLITIYMIAPWKIKIGFSKKAAKKLLSFGVPFQANSLLALIKDDLLTVYLGKVLPLAQVGYIGFAQKWALMPLRLIMDNVIRITFPSFSRIQHDKNVLSIGIEKSIFAACLFIFPAVFGLIILSPYFIRIIPQYAKWEPAIFSLSFFAINAIFSSISTPLVNALNAIGKIRTTLYLMIFWTITTWVLTPLLIQVYGFNGVSIASAIVSMSAIFVIYLIKKYVEFNAVKIIIYPLVSSFLMALFLLLLSPLFVKNLPTLIFMIIFGSAIYFLSIFLFAKKQILSDIALIRANLKS